MGTAGGALPNLIVIGAQKCGTSGLHYHLGLHPEISMSKPKELNFFIEERDLAPRRRLVQAAISTPDAAVRGEASPNYTAYPQHLGVPERIHSIVPDVRLIYMLRDPLDRIAAHWVHNYAKRREKGDLRVDALAPQHVVLWSAASTTCSFSSSCATSRWSRSWSSTKPTCASAAPTCCARSSPSSASTPTSPIPASSVSATRPLARRAPAAGR